MRDHVRSIHIGHNSTRKAGDSIQPSVRASCCIIQYNVITGPSRLYPYLRQQTALLNSFLRKILVTHC